MPTETVYGASVVSAGFNNSPNALSSANGTWATAPSKSTSIVVRMGVPVNVVSGTQTIRAFIRKNASGGNNVTYTLACEGVTLISSGITSSATGEWVSGTLSAAQIGDKNDVDVTLTMVDGDGGSPSGRRYLEVDAFEWVANTVIVTTVQLGQAASTSAAFGLTIDKKYNIALGQVQEVDSLTRLLKTNPRALLDHNGDALLDQNLRMLYGPSTALSIGIGQPIVVDTAWALQRMKAKPFGLALESAAAHAMSLHRTKGIGLAAEVDTAWAFSQALGFALGLASESDVAQVLGHARALAFGLTLESEAALSMSHTRLRQLGLALESDMAPSMIVQAANSLGVAFEIDSALGFDSAKVRELGLTQETTLAQSVHPRRDLALGPALEDNIALLLGRAKSQPLGLAAEAELAQALAQIKLRGLGLAVENDAAFGFVLSVKVALGLVEEVDSAGRFFSILTTPGALSKGLVKGLLPVFPGSGLLGSASQEGSLSGNSANAVFGQPLQKGHWK